MMLKLGENVKRLRIQKKLTQEQLADILGVSAQAISRWEHGTTYPDITLLPTIASYFEVTIDELMSMEDFKSEKRLNSFWKKYNENGSKGLVIENIQLLRNELKLCPNNCTLLYELVCQLTFCQFDCDGKDLSEEELNRNRTEAIEIGNRILSFCTDPEIINSTIKEMCYIFKWLGNTEKAMEYAKKLPSIWNSSTAVFSDVYEGPEKIKILQQDILAYAQAMHFSIRHLADLEYKDSSLTTWERIEIIQKAISVFELVYDDRDYLFDSVYISQCHRYIAAMAMLEGDHELALSSLENAAEFAIMSDTLPEKANHTSRLVNKLQYNVLDTRKNYAFSNCLELHDKMQWNRYDAIRDDKRFTDILDKISVYC